MAFFVCEERRNSRGNFVWGSMYHCGFGSCIIKRPLGLSILFASLIARGVLGMCSSNEMARSMSIEFCLTGMCWASAQILWMVRFGGWVLKIFGSMSSEIIRFVFSMSFWLKVPLPHPRSNIVESLVT